MRITISYGEALQLLATAKLQADMFERSTILAILFDMPKEETLEELLESRKEGKHK